MIEPAPQTQGELPHRALDDPLKMSVAEKLACEWEARHDVAARGRILSPAPVQQYMTHTRCENNRHAASSHPSHEHPQPESGERFEVLPLLRGWLSWEKDVR